MSAEEVAEVSAAEDETDGFVKEKFEYDAEFQSKIAVLALRDDEFLRRTAHVLNPSFFENVGEAFLVSIALKHFNKYNCAPDWSSIGQIIKDQAYAKILKGESLKATVESRRTLMGLAVHNKGYYEDKVVEFAKQQAMANAILESVPYLNKGEYAKIEELVKGALTIGVNEDGCGYDYGSRARDRQLIRIDKKLGKTPATGITTGCSQLDNLLYHRGWGRKEMALLMGGPKSGKTQALINFGRMASLAKFNVLYVTLEVSAEIISDRLDAAVAGVIMKELGDKAVSVAEAVEKAMASAGKFIIHEYGSGTFTPAMLDQLIDRYKNPGRNPDGSVRPPIKFDLVVIDYADLMRPDVRTNDDIANNKAVYTDLRANAHRHNVALLTATQTNREGAKSTVAKMDHVAEDFNKIRIADIVISINKTEEEAARNEARLYFAASRNQETGFTVVIKQNVSMMRFLEEVIRVE